MIGNSFQDLYVAACGMALPSRAQGLAHERECPTCRAYVAAEEVCDFLDDMADGDGEVDP